METVLCKTPGLVASYAADHVCATIKKNPRLVLGVATGATMVPFYAALVRRYQQKKVSFAGVRIFQLDEYVGLGHTDKNSFYSFLDTHFFRHVNLNPAKIHSLDGKSPNQREMCATYERTIKSAGGIDLQILGIGRNGHIAFDEPGSSKSSLTRLILLSADTRRANALPFGGFAHVPRHAVTQGVGTILRSGEILLLATGREKQDAVHALMRGTISRRYPATLLLSHAQVTCVCDCAAANCTQKFI